MLYFNLNRVFKAKGIDKPFTYLVKHGYSNGFATSITNNRYRKLNLDDVQKLCELLSCTPNDIIQWVPDNAEVNTIDHPLAKLLRTDQVMDLNRTLNSIPFEKLIEIEKLIHSEINKDK